MNDAWVAQPVARFWQDAGCSEPFPRTLEDSIPFALPLAVEKLPRLRLSDAVAWLARAGVSCPLPSTDRPLHGCLIAHGGHGWILLDGADPADERRFTLAHEVAHFICDYLDPRNRAAARLGMGVLAVLDGRRAPTTAERTDALLAGVALGTYTSLMERREDGTLGCAVTLGRETRADRLALELLAPAAEVRRRMDDQPEQRFEDRITHASRVLVDTFGLPPGITALYARSFCRQWYGGRTFRQWLGV